MYWLVVVSVLAAVALVWWLGMRPVPNRLHFPDSVPTMLRYLIDRGIDGGEVEFRERKAPRRRLRFVKYIRAPNHVGLYARFETCQVSPTELDLLRDELRRRAVRHEEITDASAGVLISIDCARDLGLAHLIVRIVLGAVLMIDIENECVAVFANVLVSDAPALTGVGATEAE
jgi:hypothetical protein